MKVVFTIITFIPVLLNAQQTLKNTITHDNETREYTIYIPDIYDESYPTPLMFSFHGYGSNQDIHMLLINDMRPIADTAGFIIVYPKGLPLLASPYNELHWNVGSWTKTSTSDDIGFTKAIIDSLTVDYNIDSNRVYSCGYSNGGYFSFELACQINDKIAAIGSVSGSMTEGTYTYCNPSHPTPVVTINGTSDSDVYYSGGNSYDDNSKSLSVVNNYWSNFNNTDSVEQINLPDVNTSDNSTVELSRYINGDNCTSVEHYKVVGGKHEWPGSFGNMDINSSKIIWDFVSKYDKNGLIECLPTSTIRSKASPSLETIKLYPNPFSDQITVELKQNTGKRIKIFNTIGKIVFSDFLTSGRNKIDLSFLPQNIYYVRTDNQIIKIIKTNK